MSDNEWIRGRFQVPDEEVQDRRAGGDGPRHDEERVRAAVEQRHPAGAGQVRHRLVHPHTTQLMSYLTFPTSIHYFIRSRRAMRTR